MKICNEPILIIANALLAAILLSVMSLFNNAIASSKTSQLEWTCKMDRASCDYTTYKKRKGLCKTKSGDTYEGEIRCEGSPQPDGQGMLYWEADASHYKGSFKNGLMHGEGQFSKPNGDRIKGQFVRGILNGNGQYFGIDGLFRNGTWVNGRLNGEASVGFNGESYIEVWKDGLRISRKLIVSPEMRMKIEKEKQLKVEAAKKVKLAEQQKQYQKQKARENKALNLDKCLLEVFSENPKHNQSDANFLCQSVSIFHSNTTMINCLMKKGMNKPRQLIKSAINVCSDIATDPSALDLVKYGNPLSKYLRMFD